LALAGLHLALQPLEALRGAPLRLQLLRLDAVVVPGERFAEIADAPDELALAGAAGARGRGHPPDQVLEGARFRLLDVGERLLGAAAVRASAQRELDQALVDLQLVLHEGDLQLLAA